MRHVTCAQQWHKIIIRSTTKQSYRREKTVNLIVNVFSLKSYNTDGTVLHPLQKTGLPFLHGHNSRKEGQAICRAKALPSLLLILI